MRYTPSVRIAALVSLVVLLGVGCPRQGTQPTPPPPGGVYRSDDGGVSFQQKSAVVGGGDLAQVAPREVLIDPFDPQTLYIAGDQFGLIRSSDAGEGWAQVRTPASSVTSVVIHPRNPNILYVAGGAAEDPERSKIWKSFDRGEVWEELYAEPVVGRKIEGGIFQIRRVSRPAVMSLAVDPRAPEVLYAGSESGALVASTDGGVTWSTRRSFTQGISGLRVSPRTSGQIFVRLLDGTLGRSDDGGRTAKRLTISAGRTFASTVHAVLMPTTAAAGTVLVGTDRGLFRSRDAGETWEVVPLPVSETQLVRVSTVAESIDRKLWAGSNFNLYSSTDGGSTWRVQQFAFANPIRFVLTDPLNARRLYAFFTPPS